MGLSWCGFHVYMVENEPYNMEYDMNRLHGHTTLRLSSVNGMNRKMNTTLRFFLTLSTLLLLTSCASPFNTADRAVQKQYTVDRANPLSNNGMWESNDIQVRYKTVDFGSSFTIEGTLQIKDNVLFSFPVSERFRIFIFYVDDAGSVLEKHDISPFLGYRTRVPDVLTLPPVPPAPDTATGFSFSYWGFFKAFTSEEGTSSDWEISFTPLQ